jgi:4-hydroxy-tetrahydrodipicolinate reductase
MMSYTPLNIAISGYGKMGKTIEKQAITSGHSIECILDNNTEDWSMAATASVLIDFSTPEAAPQNIERAFQLGIPVVCGTTGWWQHLSEIQSLCEKHNGTLIYGGNFSIGMNILFKLNAELANWMNSFEAYDPWILEKHHAAKKDGPGGSALQLGQTIIQNLDRKNMIQQDSLSLRAPIAEELSISFVRTGHIIGEHEVGYSGPHDEIRITHQAHSREGFANGAIWAAEKIQSLKGIIDFQALFQKT